MTLGDAGHAFGRLSLLHRGAAALARAILSSTARVRVEGLEGLPRDGPLIVVANHISNADPPLVGGWLQPALGRPLTWLAKEQLFVGPLGRFMRSQGVIMVRAGGSDADAYRRSKMVLDRGGVLVVFPEGTRSPTGELQRARAGVALLAVRTGVPVLPAGVSGTDRFVPPGTVVPRIGSRITLRVGRPSPVVLDPAMPRREALEVATDELMRRIAALVDERHRGQYGTASTDGSPSDEAPSPGSSDPARRREM